MPLVQVLLYQPPSGVLGMLPMLFLVAMAWKSLVCRVLSPPKEAESEEGEAAGEEGAHGGREGGQELKKVKRGEEGLKGRRDNVSSSTSSGSGLALSRT